MIQRVFRPLLIGFIVTFLALLVAFPILALLMDAGGSGSLEIGMRSLLLYRFMREGTGMTSTLVPAGLLAFSLLGALVNLILSSLLARSSRT